METLKNLRKQYKQIKAQYPDAVLLFRCGDYYEAYDADAELIAKILSIPIVTKDDNSFTQIARFAYSLLETYLPKLVRAGNRIAICDQLDPPDETKRLRQSATMQPPKPTQHSSLPRPSQPETWIQATLF